MSKDISTKRLEQYAKAASRQAIRKAHDLNVPIVVQEGRNIVRVSNDGGKVVVGRLDKAYVTVKKKQFSLSN